MKKFMRVRAPSPTNFLKGDMMNRNIKNFIKTAGILISLGLLILLCAMVVSFNKARYEEMNTPVHIIPSSSKIRPKTQALPQTPVKKPITRDENNMPKSDYKVPEIG